MCCSDRIPRNERTTTIRKFNSAHVALRKSTPLVQTNVLSHWERILVESLRRHCTSVPFAVFVNAATLSRVFLKGEQTPVLWCLKAVKLEPHPFSLAEGFA